MFFGATLADFGHGTMTVGGRPATGGRPLLMVLVNWAGQPPISDVHGDQYYERLAFGNPTPPFSTMNPVNPASMREPCRENSYGRFWFDRVGVIHPSLGVPFMTDPGSRAVAAR